MLAWPIAVREDPYRPGTASVPGGSLKTRLAPLPSAPRLAFFYAVDDDARVLTALLIESI